MTESDARRLLALGREAELTGAEADAWAGRLRPEREALQAAVTWLAANSEAGEAVELAVSVWRLWLLEGDVAGGRALLAAALGADGVPSAARARALYAAGLLAFRAGEQEESRTRNEQALALARELGDPEAEALALVGLSRVASREGDFVRVREFAAQAPRARARL